MNSAFQIDTVFWIIAGFLTLYYSDLINVIKVDNRVDTSYLYASVTLTVIPIAIACYFIFYLTVIKQVHSDDWESNTPFAIPIATGCAVAAGIMWNISLWNVYQFYTPIILFLLFMGLVMTVSVLPPWNPNPTKPHHND